MENNFQYLFSEKEEGNYEVVAEGDNVPLMKIRVCATYGTRLGIVSLLDSHFPEGEKERKRILRIARRIIEKISPEKMGGKIIYPPTRDMWGGVYNPRYLGVFPDFALWKFGKVIYG